MSHFDDLIILLQPIRFRKSSDVILLELSQISEKLEYYFFSAIGFFSQQINFFGMQRGLRALSVSSKRLARLVTRDQLEKFYINAETWEGKKLN